MTTTVQVLTDEQIRSNIHQRFGAMMTTLECIIDPFNTIRAMIVTGAPGVGKSYNLIKRLEQAHDNLECDFHKISGKVTPLGLYQALNKTRHFGSVLLLDDVDVFEDEGTLDILKAALDSSKTRTVSYISNSNVLRKEGIPNQIEYSGKIIFVSNKNFMHILNSNSKLQPHVKALVTRGTFIDLQIHDTRSILIQIEDVLTHTDMLTKHVSVQQQKDILDFMKSNADRLLEPSLRTPINISGLVLHDAQNWKNTAEVSFLKSA
ncbi:hypothetical protein XaC1_555 [Xanthomonas phage XaC1]|nr:hypothetical protein XaC1_555 [Xanthomonas phage XaC1]